MIPHLSGRTGLGEFPGHEELAGESAALGAEEDQLAGFRNPRALGQDQGDDHKGQHEQALQLHVVCGFLWL